MYRSWIVMHALFYVTFILKSKIEQYLIIVSNVLSNLYVIRRSISVALCFIFYINIIFLARIRNVNWMLWLFFA